MGKLAKATCVLLSLGVLERLCALHEQDSFQERRIGFHQGKTEARWLYFFISHIYDGVLNPWHWDEPMRDAALAHANIEPQHRCADVGAGTGFTSLGVAAKLASPAEQLVMLDQSPDQLRQARKKRALDGVPKLVGDAEALPANWTGAFDRYTSAGSIEYWPAPHVGIREAHRILRPGGRATIIGPVRPTFWLSRFFADMWYLFPEEQEYVAWFKEAGFENVRVHQVTPSWYEGDRAHGLIMGCVAVGDKPAAAASAGAGGGDDGQPAAATPSSSSASASASARPPRPLFDALMAPSRFLLGNVGGVYYALLPIGMYLKHVLGVSWLVLLALLAVLLAVPIYALVKLRREVLPTAMEYSPLGACTALYEGIGSFYDSSSSIWETVWGEHMHTGHYGDEGQDAGKKTHLQAQDDMIDKLIDFASAGSAADDDACAWSNALHGTQAFGDAVDVLDMGCGVGGATRHIARLVHCNALGVSLSPYQVARAKERSAAADERDEFKHAARGTSTVDFKVANALHLDRAPGGGIPDDSFDLVWSLESGEHMPDKEVWMTEVYRVLRPGGVFACATWCHRELDERPLDEAERTLLARICKNYFLPEWVPVSRYADLAASLGMMDIRTADWTKAVLPFWPAVIRSALWPSSLVRLLFAGWATIKGAITAVLMMQGFDKGLLVFGVIACRKPYAPEAEGKGRGRAAAAGTKAAAKSSPRSRKRT